MRFAKLEEIPLYIVCIVYFQPYSGTFGALYSFVLDIAGRKCYVLQMTLNKHHVYQRSSTS